MFYLQVDNDKRVYGIHSQEAFDSYSETQLIDIGELYKVSSIPNPIIKKGKDFTRMYDETKGEIYYEYFNIPKSLDELTIEEINSLKLENAELMMKSAITNTEIETVKNENAELLFRVANLEMGGML